MASCPTASPLPSGRRAALEALLSGATPEAAAEQLGWSAARVVREARAGLLAAEPEHFARLDAAARGEEIQRRLGLDTPAAGSAQESRPAAARAHGPAAPLGPRPRASTTPQHLGPPARRHRSTRRHCTPACASRTARSTALLRRQRP